MTEHTFTTWDGTALAYRAWVPPRATRAVYLFHRGHEHSGRWEQTVAALGLADTAFFAWDQRGHGKSPGKRGHAPGFAALTQDADAFARHVSAAHGIPLEDSCLIASSVGAVIASAWVHDFAPPLRAMVLVAPAFRVRLYVPMAIPSLRVLGRIAPQSEVKSYVKSHLLTHDRAEAAAYDADPLLFRQISVKMLLDLYDAGTRLMADAQTIQMPTLLLAAGSDWVVSLPAQKRFFARLGSPIKQMEVYPGMHHALLHETQRDRVTDHIRVFLQERFAAAPAALSTDGDKAGPTRAEYDLLRTPETLRWPLTRAGLRVGGIFSNGIRLGFKTGFDSGRTLDYVYRNKATGFPLVGQLIDRNYLNAPGWRGIRVRREQLEAALERAVREMHAAGRPVRILDIASGPGRYVLETMARLKEIPAAATLRDYQQPNLDAARALADRLALPNVTTQLADAFNGTPPPPLPATIAIASGLYELFPENAPVLRSLTSIAAAVEAEGLLIYTCQIWHPQLEFIARALVNREGKQWVMRRRTQAEMDALVRAAGFEKVGQRVDPWGIFTVSVARRVRV